MAWRAPILACALALAACQDDLPPTGQLLLYVDSDAWLPPPAGELAAAGEPAPLFDTLEVEVYQPAQELACEGCSRTFALDRRMLAEGRASFGLPLEADVDGYRVRLRLYHSASTLTGAVPPFDELDRPPQSVIDVIVSLPAVAKEGIVERHVVMLTDQVGTQTGSLEAPIETAPGAPQGSRVGSWPHALRLSCAGPPQAGEVCVPGGAYWMGNARVRGSALGDANDRRRLVVVSPFYLDATETTVAQYRGFDDGSLHELYAWSGNDAGNDWRDFCTFTPAPGPHDDKPVVCLSFEGARAYCQARGADLPTEAQIEYAASALESRLFVWGSDEPACQDAVLQRFGYGLFAGLKNACTPPLPPGGVELVGSRIDPPRLDRLELEGGTLFDVIGNATEWALDLWNRQGEPCWYQGGVLMNPLCNQPSPSEGQSYRVFRTGSWVVGPRQAAAAYRSPLIGSIDVGQGIDLGFRCARAAGGAP